MSPFLLFVHDLLLDVFSVSDYNVGIDILCVVKHREFMGVINVMDYTTQQEIIWKTIGDRIKTQRKLCGYTQDALSDILNCDRGVLGKYEKGIRHPSLEFMFQICRVCKCDIGYLLGEYDEKTRTNADICKETGLNEKVIEKLHERAEFDKKYPQYKNGLEHLNTFIEKCGFHIFDYLSEYLESVTLCGALEKRYPKIDFISNNLKFVVEKGKIKKIAISRDEKEAIKTYCVETEEKQPLYLYNLQKMFIDFAESYGEEKKKQATIDEFIKHCETHSDTVQTHSNDLSTSFDEFKKSIIALGDKAKDLKDKLVAKEKDGVNNGGDK